MIRTWYEKSTLFKKLKFDLKSQQNGCRPNFVDFKDCMAHLNMYKRSHLNSNHIENQKSNKP